jgi:hypothetical protein
MAVRKLSTLVPVEQICSMNGVVSVRLHSFPQHVNIFLTVFQGSRRVDLWHIRSSKTLYYFGHAEKNRNKDGGYKWRTTETAAANNQSRYESCVSHVLECRCFRVVQVDYQLRFPDQRNVCREHARF